MLHAGRLRVLSIAILAAWLGLLGRAFHVQVLQASYWEGRALERQGEIQSVAANRGQIRTADGAVFAHSVPNRSLAVDPSLVDDPDELAVALADAGLVQRREFLRTLETHRARQFLWIDRGLVPERTIDALLDGFPALTCEVEGKRIYPMGRAAAGLVGVVGRDGHGLSGLEASFDEVLRGKDGQLLDISDRFENRFRGLERQLLDEPQPGQSLVLSIHSQIQEIVSTRIHEVVAREDATSGFVIVTRPQTGEILAFASAPAPEPMRPESWTSERLRLPGIEDSFEPGSVYKIVAFAAALERGCVSPEEMIDCMDGVRPTAGGRPIRDHEPCGVVPAWQVLAESSNIGTGVIAEAVGAEGFYRMEKSLGFGLPSGIELLGEGRGRIPSPSDRTVWSGRSLITQAFGQEVSTTGIQLAMAYGAIANGGNLMRPLLVREIRDPDGTLVRENRPEVVRQVLRPVVARTMRLLLRGVVEQGTGKGAEIADYPTAGKTGTAQKYIVDEKSYSRKHYVASFVGFAPWDDPDVLCLVVVDEPRSDIYGGSVSAPVFAQIVSDIRPLIENSNPKEPWILDSRRWHAGGVDVHREVPRLVGLSGRVARRVVAESGFLPRLEGAGAWVQSSEPPEGAPLVEGGVVTLRLGGDDSRVMPDLAGLSLRDALLRLRSLDVVPVVEGAGWVSRQEPQPGTRIGVGTECRIRLDANSSRAWKEYEELEKRTARDLAAGAVSGGSKTKGSSASP